MTRHSSRWISRTASPHALRWLATAVFLATSGCAHVKTAASALGEVASEVLEEASADTSSDRRAALRGAASKAVERRAGDTLTAAQRAELRAAEEANLRCAHSDYDAYFTDVFRMYADSRDDAGRSEVAKNLGRTRDRMVGRMLRVCADLTDRILAGEEPIRGSTTAERLAALLAKESADYVALRREMPAFRTWVGSMREVR